MDPLSNREAILIYADQINPRISYSIEVFFQSILKLPVRWVDNVNDFIQSEGPKLNYGLSRRTPEELFIPFHQWMQYKDVLNFSPSLFKYNKIPALFHCPESGGDLPFDVFAASFYFLARVEEYNEFTPDKHGRFPAKSAWSVQAGLQELPLVDIWAKLVLEKLAEKYPEHAWETPGFKYQATYDMDLPWKYRYRGFWRSLAGFCRSILRVNPIEAFERLLVLAGRRPDPYYTFPELKKLHSRIEKKPLFFVPLGKYGPHDKNIAIRHTAYQQLVRELNAVYPVGLHPSYRSFDEPDELRAEVENFKVLCGKGPVKSRSHYLRFRIPQTYRQLLASGIREDYSMGYAEMPGFRAGTANAFPWFDLEKNQQTALWVHPFAFMDVSLKNYQGYSPETALLKMQAISNTIKESGGTLISIWHNNSLEKIEEWANWNSLYPDWINWISKSDK